ncbi:MAG: DNA-binding protein [Bacteroidales bacterium]|nr:DNA-binding protein [Bacteroidales bacterium]
MYKYKKVRRISTNLFEDGNPRFIVSLDNHVEIMEGLAAFCRDKRIFCGQVRGIGAVCEATFRMYDPATKEYVDKTFSEQMEITNLTGNISEKDGKPYLHVHATCSRADYSCIGGHLLSARINGACELLVDKFGDTSAGRRLDPETGLNLYDL